MSERELQRFLARLYVEPDLRAAFLSAPERLARDAGLSADAARALAAMDFAGLELAAHSFEIKRASRPIRLGGSLLERLRRVRKRW